MRSVSPLNRTLMSATVTVATFSNMQEASIVQGMLESNGIPSMISDQNNLYVPVFGGVNLLVYERDAPRALELLKFCKERLFKADKEVEKCLDEMKSAIS